MGNKEKRLPYESPNLEAILIDTPDIITSSTTLGGTDGNPDYDGSSWT